MSSSSTVTLEIWVNRFGLLKLVVVAVESVWHAYEIPIGMENGYTSLLELDIQQG